MAYFIGCGIVLKQDNKYILVQETRNEKAGLYNLPAGTLELHEDFLQAVRRETKEETGVDTILEHFVGVYQTVIASGSNVVFLIFSGSVPDNAVFHSEEHEAIQAFSYEELIALDEAKRLRSPIVRKSVEDYQKGQRLPLGTVQTWHIDSLPAITVEKGH
ncbi:MAG TPA: NUDIX domain-containing protein [Candidatus Saccharimonadales bacterium]|nr:NUDIX domain-containing protein [Candidatus Saccharimonadales bacterium]